MKAKPFLKWVGGKNQLLKQFEDFYPKELRSGEITNYIEPFIGGGAVFFDVIQKYNISNAYISDVNQDLILVYKTIQILPNILIEILSEYQKKYIETPIDKRKQHFLEQRLKYNEQRFNFEYNIYSDKWASRAALFIFLNKTCFNGLFRVNSKGGFNVPFGKYKNPKIADIPNLYRVHNLLKNVEIRCADYSKSIRYMKENTFVYVDPPYRPISKSASFTSYTKSGFNDKNQEQLADFINTINRIKNLKVMLSNSDPKNGDKEDNFFEHLYSDYNIHRVKAARAINSKGSGRGRINEILVTNYECKK